MARLGFGFGFGVLAGALLATAACGSRSPLLVGEGGSGGSGAASGTGGLGASGGASGGGGSGGSAGSAAAAGSAGAGGTPVVCDALVAGPAVPVITFSDRHATAPSAVLVPELAPPRVALQAFATGGSSALHDDIRLARFVVDDAAPAGISLEIEPMLVGIESHGWGNLVHASGDLRALALAWHGDPGGLGRPMFRTIDVDSWQPGAPIDLVTNPGGEAVIALAAGASTGPFGVGYSGNGYAVVWRNVQPGPASARPVAAVLDASGQPMIGPHEVSPTSPYPGRSPSVVWSGSTYLLATAVQTCTPGVSSCVENSIVVSRIRPASGDAVDDSGVEIVSMEESGPDWVPGRPALAQDGTMTRVAWIERPAVTGSAPPRVVVRTLTDDGHFTAGVTILPTTGDPQSRVTLSVHDGVAALAWAEDGDATLPDSSPGRSKIVVYRLDAGVPKSAQVPSPLFHDYGAPTVIHRGVPGGLLAVWGARSMDSGFDITYAARLDCQKQSAATYEAAWGPPTALNRLRVIKRDPERDLCFQIGLASPHDSVFPVSLPPSWGIEGIAVRQGASGCNQPPWSPGGVQASSATGVIDWPNSSSQELPCVLSLDMSATFPPNEPWVPVTEPFFASNLPVTGGPCGG